MTPRRFCACMLLTACLAAVVPSIQASEATADPNLATPDREKLRTAMLKFADWRNSLDTLDVVYTWEDPLSRIPYSNRQHVPSRTQSFRTRMQWQDWWTSSEGQNRRVSTECMNTQADIPHTISGRNGKFQYFAEYAPGLRIPHLFTVSTVGSKKTLQAHEQMPLLPIYFATTDWFSGAFCELPVKSFGTRMIDGHECIGLAAENGESLPIFWLDLEHDGLPRLIEPGDAITKIVWHCEEFVQLENQRWFPKRGTFGIIGQPQCKFEVDSIAVNQRMEQSQFELPKVGKATYVRDLTNRQAPLNKFTLMEEREQFSMTGQFTWWKLECCLILLFTSAGWVRWLNFRKQLVPQEI